MKLRIAGAVVLFLVLWAVPVPVEPRVQLCGFHWLTGRLCPLCGLTRALFSLAKGHWQEAFRFHALSPLGLVMLLSLFWRSPLQARLWTAGLAALACYGVVRLAA